MTFWPVIARRAGSRAEARRTTLIPNQWDGSVQHYYHFMLGYLVPIFRWMTSHPKKPISVRDCGPMNQWFELLRENHEIEILNVGDVLHILAGKLSPHQVLRGMDNPQKFSSCELRRFAAFSSEIAAAKVGGIDTTEVLISARTTSDPFYNSEKSEAQQSGQERRSIPNLHEVVETWSDNRVSSVDMSTLNIYDQIWLHTQARVLIGQHGAGLTSMLWMSPGSTVIEILPPTPRHTQEIFANLARALDLNHIVVPQLGLHAPIDIEQITQALDQAR